ncbi:post-GPI attachment to proteins factor 6-like [Pollicipes pollicipes]|uniref:post-GPI attachment to proteins factor 6-like n=1 Tax=Pollicipes pollicipes TaxID=41117 RepID=UPI0018855162|nr:post-GPI attachment to proteins factor 6-like [Pollicipes pollicipes]
MPCSVAQSRPAPHKLSPDHGSIDTSPPRTARYLQHGSYPVVNPENASQPAELYERRAGLLRLALVTGTLPHEPTRLTVAAPLDGPWYAVAYIAPWDRAVAQQVSRRWTGPGEPSLDGPWYAVAYIAPWDRAVAQQVSRCYSGGDGQEHEVRVCVGVLFWDQAVAQQGSGGSRGITHRCLYSLGSIGYWHQERPQLLETNRPLTIRTIARTSYFKFHVPSDTESVSVRVSGCRVVEPAGWRCGPRALPTSAPSQDAASPEDAPVGQLNISGVREGRTYRLEPDQLWLDAYYHLAVVAESNAVVNLTVTLTHCEFVASEGRPPTADVTADVSGGRQTNGSVARPTSPRCWPLTELTRIKYAQDFTDTFLAVNAAFYYTWVHLTDRRPHSVRFETREFVDVGGTLYVDLQLNKLLTNDSAQVVTVECCLSAHVLPVSAAGRLRCEPPLAFRLSSASEAETRAIRLLPFPEPAVWYISMVTRCSSRRSGATLPCVRSKYLVNLDVHTQPCVWPDAPCGRHGTCRETHRGQHYFTSCSCRAVTASVPRLP